MLRQARIQTATSVVDLACGWGQTTQELAQRSNARVIGVDRNRRAIDYALSSVPGCLQDRLSFLQADAVEMPLASESQDIVFTQCGLLWIRQTERALQECRRVLKPNGFLVMIEPDYDGMMEYPPEIASRELWKGVIENSGGSPIIGRALPALCEANDFACHAYFLDRYQPPDPSYLEFLKELPATSHQTSRIQEIEQEWQRFQRGQIVVHLPFWLLIARPR